MDVSDRLGPLYARYGLLASLVLAAIASLKQEGDQHVKPAGDDVHRLNRLREVLTTSWEGGVVGGVVSGESRLTWEPTQVPARSTRNKLDDVTVIRRVLPGNYELETFVPRADQVLNDLMRAGVAGVEDREFLDGPFVEFLERLAKGNRAAVSSTRRAGRQRVPLA